MENEEEILEAIAAETDLSALVGHYVGFRDQKEVIKKELAQRTSPLDACMDRIEARLLELMTQSGQENAKTKFGTAYKVTQTGVKVADWNVLVEYIKKNDAYDLLVKNVAKDAVKARIEENGVVVPGVDLTTFIKVNVLRS